MCIYKNVYSTQKCAKLSFHLFFFFFFFFFVISQRASSLHCLKMFALREICADIHLQTPCFVSMQHFVHFLHTSVSHLLAK